MGTQFSPSYLQMSPQQPVLKHPQSMKTCDVYHTFWKVLTLWRNLLPPSSGKYIGVDWTLLVIRDSAVGIATGYGPEGRSSSPGRVKIFSPLQIVQTGFRAHPASYSVVTDGSFTGVKAAEA
jgi:hypothetical protein